MKQENRSSKTLKGQLLGAISMMLVAAIALGTSTYAWFINNQDVKVDAMQLTVETSSSMMVSVGKDGATVNGVIEALPANWTGYKTVITNDDITGLNTAKDAADWANMFVFPLDPASITDANLAKGGGTTTAATAAPEFFHADGKVSNGKLTHFTKLDFGATNATLGQGYVKRIPLKFLASKTTDVYWGDTSNKLIATTPDITKMIVAGSGGVVNGVTAEDQAKGIRAALRLAVVPHDTATIILTADKVNSAAKVFQFDAGGKLSEIASGNNTDYGPYALNSIVTNVNEATGVYAGIETVGTSPNNTVLTAGKLTVLPPDSGNNYVANYTSGAFAKVATTGKPLFTLAANEPREVDVYIWLDGTDQDCVSILSQYGFSLNMPFAAVMPVAP